MIRLRKLISGWTLVEWACAAGALLVILLAAGWLLTEPGRQKARAVQAEAATELAGARTAAAADAGQTLDRAHAETTASEALSRETADVIRQAPGADQRLDPALNRVGRERLCERPSYRNTRECKLADVRP